MPENEIHKLKNEIKDLKLQLARAKESIDAIRAERVDALIVPNNKDLKIFTDKAADKLYRVLIEKMHEGAVILDKDGTILYCNSCFSTMVNLSLQKIIGGRFTNFIDDSPDHLEALMKRGWVKAQKGDFHLKTTEGKHTPVLLSVNSLQVDNADVMSIIITDLTNIRQNQEALKKLNAQLETKVLKRTSELELTHDRLKQLIYDLEKINKSKDNFISIISHDLRNPITTIISYAEIITTNIDTLKKNEIEKYVNIIHRSSYKIIDQLGELVEWSKQKNKQIYFNPQQENLYEFVVSSLELVQAKASQHKINIVNAIDKRIVVEADPLLLRSIFQNLITNSIKFTPEDGKITIDASIKNDAFVEISIADTGIGISGELKTKLLSGELVTANAEDSKTFGLGLFLVRDFVETHKGHVWIESEPGEGATFYFTLPLAN